MTRDELIETLAGVEHQRWADWQKHLHSKCEKWGAVGSDVVDELVIPKELFERWERQIVQPYAQLSEAEKQRDRDQVMRYWPVLVQFVAEWIEGHNGWGDEGAVENACAWREDMA